jgi:pimeloyl-ACP methyl ester carboxylesterase
MSAPFPHVVLPRPGVEPPPSKPSIPGPSEESFTSTFGTLLPPAQYLTTNNGKAAYYLIPPSSSSGSDTKSPERVLFIHGVQTPALGMLPLARKLHASFPSAHFALMDLWGHGLSDTPVTPHESGLFHGLIDTLLDHLEWPSAHLVGFSFGASLTAGYVATRATRVQSYTLIAPAGLIKSASFTVAEQAHFRHGCDEDAAQKWVVSWLEGGELTVPADWKERIAKGEVVAESLRAWQTHNHSGHTASVVAIVRDGGVMDNQKSFGKAVATAVPSIVVLGEKDDLSTEQELRHLGFKNVFVVPGAGHGVVRERVPEVAGFISEFWRQ